MFDKNDYGKSGLNQNKLLDIVKARKALYDQWQGRKPHLGDYLPQLLGQGKEYSAMGAIIARKYKNPLVLGADHSAMASFYEVEKKIPIMYLKRIYE